MRARHWVALAALLVAAVANEFVRGVPKAKQSEYTKDAPSFTCKNGLVTIPFAHVNDDYCDCPDGSDEPGTSACRNSQFYCENRLHKGTYISSSKVNDGICDCCDGTDEWQGRATCPNKCREVGDASRAAEREKNRETLQGVKIREEYIAKGQTGRAEQIEKHDKLKAEQDELNPKLDQLETVKKAAERLEKIARARLNRLAKEKEEAEKEANAAAAPPPPAAADANLPPLPPGAPPREGELTNEAHKWREENGFEDAEGEAAAAEDADDDDEENTDAAAPPPPPAVKTAEEKEAERQAAIERDEGGAEGLELVPAGTEDEKIEDNAAEGEGVEEYYGEGEGTEEVKPVEDAIPVEVDTRPISERELESLNFAELDQEEARLRAFIGERYLKPTWWDRLWAPYYWLPFVFDNPPSAGEKAKKEWQEVKDKVTSLDREIDELRKKKELDLGTNLEFFPLVGNCYTLKMREYDYELCPFGDAHQKARHGSSTLLGRWKSWTEPYKRFKFEDGQQCYNGPRRSIEVSLECGSKEEVLSVEEPSMCTYKAVMRTPAVCFQPHADLSDLDGAHGEEGENY